MIVVNPRQDRNTAASLKLANEIKSKLKIPRTAYKLDVKGQLRLPFDSRQKSRLRATLVSGEEVGLMLPRGETCGVPSASTVASRQTALFSIAVSMWGWRDFGILAKGGLRQWCDTKRYSCLKIKVIRYCVDVKRTGS